MLFSNFIVYSRLKKNNYFFYRFYIFHLCKYNIKEYSSISQKMLIHIIIRNTFNSTWRPKEYTAIVCVYLKFINGSLENTRFIRPD